MGKRIVAVRLDDEQVVFAEVEESDLPTEEDPLAPIADVDELVAQASGSVESALDAVIVPTTQMIFSRITRAPYVPAAVEVEFGLKLTGKLGAVFASTEAEGHILVKLTWNRTEPVGPGRPPISS
jgi:Trypsin-co-occurring domain 1